MASFIHTAQRLWTPIVLRDGVCTKFLLCSTLSYLQLSIAVHVTSITSDNILNHYMCLSMCTQGGAVEGVLVRVA
jgi:hypothetical protein